MFEKIIDEFRGDYYYLSNFYPSKFVLDGDEWQTVEHYYQAQKVLGIDDEMYNKIKNAETPRKARRLGNKCVLRDDWDDYRLIAMKRALEKKFKLGSKLCNRLLDTRSAELIEGTTWHDNFWGNCVCDKCKDIKGLNNLGKQLMEIREIRRSEMENRKF